MDLAVIAVLALLVAATLYWATHRVTAAPPPQSEVWIRRTTTIEEYRSTGSPTFEPDPRYATLRPPTPMLEAPR